MHRFNQKSPISSQYSAAPLDNKPLFRFGFVESINTNTFTADVRVDRSETCESCPILNLMGRSLGSDMVWLQSIRGSYVILINILGVYHILSTLPGNFEERNEFHHATTQLSDGTVDTTGFEQSFVRDFTQNRPRDFLADDKIIRTEDGTELSLFRGGLARIKASPMAQLVLGKIKDFARLVARKFQVFCDFGEITSYQSPEGRTTLHIKGGADYQEETHPNVAKWTVQSWFGDYPGNPATRFFLQTNSPELDEYTIQSANINGQIFVETTDDYAHQVGRNYLQFVANDVRSSVERNATYRIKNDYNVDVHNEGTISADKALTLFSTGGVTLTSGAKLALTGGEEATLSAQNMVKVFANDEIQLGVDELNNLSITPLGVFITDAGQKRKPFFLPKGIVGGAGPIESGFPGGMALEPLPESLGAASIGAESPGVIGKPGDLVITLTPLADVAANMGEGGEPSPEEDNEPSIILAATPDIFISINKNKIRLQASALSFLEITPIGISIAGLSGQNEPDGAGEHDGP